MAKLRLKLKTTVVNSVAGIVDLKFNGSILRTGVELATTDTTLEYDVTLSTTNTLEVDLINAQSGTYDSALGTWPNGTVVTIDEVAHSSDGTTYSSVIPQAKTSFTTVPGPTSDAEVTLRPQLTSAHLYGRGYLIEFDSNGLLNQPDFTVKNKPFNPVATWDGSVYTTPTGETMSKEEKVNMDNS